MEVQPLVLSLFGTKNLSQQFQVKGQPTFHFLTQAHCFVPCNLYQGEVSLERPFQSELNCFETAVIGLLALSHRDMGTLAEMLCFPDPSFIRLLLSDLKDRGYIDGEHRLTDYGKEKMEQEKEGTPEKKTADATFFQNALTGALLPYVYISQSPLDNVDRKFLSCHVDVAKKEEEEPSHPHPEEHREEPSPKGRSRVTIASRQKTLSFSVGTAGEKTTISGRAFVPSSAPPFPPPTSREAARRLQEYHQYTKNTTATSYGETDWTISSQYLGDALHLSPLYQTRYLHLQGGKVEGDADSLILSDGFFPSLVDLVHYLETEESGWVQLLHQNAIVARRFEEETIYENQLYPQLKGGWLDALSTIDGTKDREKALEATIRRCVVEMYGELEWALHYYFKAHPYSPTLLQDYRGKLPSENRVALANILDKTNLLQGEVDLISQFSGKTNVSKGAPSMTVLVPLLLLTWDKGESTLLSVLQKALPDFYRNLSYLHPIRNKAIHQGLRTLSLEDFRFYQEFSATFLDLVLPDWKKRHFVRKQVNENNSDTNRRLSAMKSLHEEFGFAYVKQHLTEEMVETLLQLAPENRQPSSPPQYIKGLCLLLELSFAQQLQLMHPAPEGQGEEREENMDENKSKNKGKNKKKYKEKYPQAEWLPSPLTTSALLPHLEGRYHTTLPPSLNTVTQAPLALALSGAPSTLGAEVLAYLYLDTTGTGDYLVKKDALNVIHHIISLRGHGNQQDPSSLLLDNEDLEGLRRSVVSIMKGLVTYGKKEQA